MDDDPAAHPSLPTSAAASTMRFEKPHSLSYHDSTRQKRLPSTDRLGQVEGRAVRIMVEIDRHDLVLD